jgi:hypothetical protein
MFNLTLKERDQLVDILGRVNSAGLSLRELAAELPQEGQLHTATEHLRAARELIETFLRE